MVAPMAILAQPDDHRGILAMSEAVDAMLEAFRNWAKDPLLGELRRRTHTPKNVRPAKISSPRASGSGSL